MITTLKSQGTRFTADPQKVKLALLAIAILTALAGTIFPDAALAGSATGGGHTGG